jgi:hypothetical protein
MDYRLIKTQQNDVFRVVEHALSPRNFRWSERGIRTSYISQEVSAISVLIHFPSQFYYEFGPDYETFSPGHETRVETVKDASSWLDRLSYVATWTGLLKREVEAPDLWSQHFSDIQVRDVVASSDVSNTPFSPSEKEQIALLLQDLKQKVFEAADIQTNQSEQIEAINENVGYLKSATDRVGRKDWILMAISTVINVMTTALLPGNTAKALLHSFIATVGPIVTGGVRLIL